RTGATSAQTNSTTRAGNRRAQTPVIAATDQTRAQNNPPAIEIRITMCSASLTVIISFSPGKRIGPEPRHLTGLSGVNDRGLTIAGQGLASQQKRGSLSALGHARPMCQSHTVFRVRFAPKVDN